jgi:hypothetical protein
VEKGLVAVCTRKNRKNGLVAVCTRKKGKELVAVCTRKKRKKGLVAVCTRNTRKKGLLCTHGKRAKHLFVDAQQTACQFLKLVQTSKLSKLAKINANAKVKSLRRAAQSDPSH